MGWGWQNNGIFKAGKALRLSNPKINPAPLCSPLITPPRAVSTPGHFQGKAGWQENPSFSPTGIWEPNKSSQELLSLVKSFIYRMGNIYNVILIQKELTGNTEKEEWEHFNTQELNMGTDSCFSKRKSRSNDSKTLTCCYFQSKSLPLIRFS